MAYGVAPMAPIRTLWAAPSGSTLIPLRLLGFFRADFAILDRRFPPPIRANRVLRSGIGRLKPGVTLKQAQARLTAMAAQLRHDFPTDYPPQAQWTIEIQPLQETLVG